MASSSTSVMGDSPPYISRDVSPRLLTSVPYEEPVAAGGEDGPGSGDPPSLSSLVDSLLSSAVSDSSSPSLSSVIVSSDLKLWIDFRERLLSLLDRELAEVSPLDTELWSVNWLGADPEADVLWLDQRDDALSLPEADSASLAVPVPDSASLVSSPDFSEVTAFPDDPDI